MHDAAGHEGKEAGDHERAGKNRNHGVAVPADAMTPRVQDGERQHREREDREQMDRAPRAPNAQLVNPKRARDHAASCTAPSPKAAKAEKACSWMAGAAFNSGASDTARSPHAALAGLP